ncbi:MAG: ankyrin repeat domain-containing protein [Bacteroidota bacterium]
MPPPPPKPARPPKGDPLADDLVKEFVGVSHGNFERVKELLEQEPRLLNATWDWGGGDFESGLEAAGHVGNREIAAYLLAKGARMNIFCAAMLGHLDIVQATLTAYPDLKTSKGPHGLMLLHHAQRGGEQAKHVLAYLEEIGAS